MTHFIKIFRKVNEIIAQDAECNGHAVNGSAHRGLTDVKDISHYILKIPCGEILQRHEDLVDSGQVALPFGQPLG